MNIAALSMAFNQSKVQQQARMSVMKMAIDTAEQNTVNMFSDVKVKAAEQSVKPHLGSKLNVRV